MFRIAWAAVSAFCLLSIEPASSCELPSGSSGAAGAYLTQGIRSSGEKRADCFRKAAERGHRTAQYFLGGLYFRGEEVPQDAGQAAFWYRRAASGDGLYDGSAAWSLATLYFTGEGVELDIAEGLKWAAIGQERKAAYAGQIATLTKNAQRGDRESQFDLGVKYLIGEVPGEIGTASANRTGIAWLRKAAIGGHDGALTFLAGAHRTGHWAPKNPYRAMQWLKVGAKRGDAASQYALGEMYANGEGVQTNYAVAYVWYNLAASSSDKSIRRLATIMRDAIHAVLTPTERKEMAEISTAIWEMGPPPTVPPPAEGTGKFWTAGTAD